MLEKARFVDRFKFILSLLFFNYMFNTIMSLLGFTALTMRYDATEKLYIFGDKTDPKRVLKMNKTQWLEFAKEVSDLETTSTLADVAVEKLKLNFDVESK